MLTIDLESQTITRPDGEKVHFDIDPFRKHCLLNGLDDIGLTEQKSAEIAAYEQKTRAERPWLFGMTDSRAEPPLVPAKAGTHDCGPAAWHHGSRLRRDCG